jgi:hypothetical protein
MVAGILQNLGVDMGPCQPPDAANPLGYFEDVRFMGLHRAWSRRYETDPDRARLRLPPRDPAPGPTDLDRYARLIRAASRRPRWGVKDPELCYYAGQFVAALMRPIRVVATTRDLGAIAASLASRRHYSAAECDAVAAEYARRQARTLGELAARGDGPPLTVDYDDALADPDAAVRRIAEHVGLEATEAAAAFVSPALRRHRR